MKKNLGWLVLSIFTLAVGCTTSEKTNVASNSDAMRDLASGKCDAEAFVTRIRTKCTLSKNDEKRIRQNAEYCKQIANKYEMVTMKESGDVVVLNTGDCSRMKYEVDSSGVDVLKIIQKYAYMTSNDGQLYIFSGITTNFYELRSNSGKSYSKANSSNVTDLKGNQGGTKVISTHANGTEQEWDSDKVNSMPSNRLRQLRFWNFPSNASVYND